jgi:hypothetical protein
MGQHKRCIRVWALEQPACAMYDLSKSSGMNTMTQFQLQVQQNEQDSGSTRLWWAASLCFGLLALAVWMLNGNALFMEMVTSAWALCF